MRPIELRKPTDRYGRDERAMRRCQSANYGASWLLLLLLLIGAWDRVSPASAGQVPEAFAARLGGDERRTRFVVDLSGRVGFRAYVIPEPYRVVVDLEELRFRLPVGLGWRGLGLVKAFRYGLIDAGRSRIVMDTKGPVLLANAFIVEPEFDQPARLVIDIMPTDPPTFAALYKRQSMLRNSGEETEEAEKRQLKDESGIPIAPIVSKSEPGLAALSKDGDSHIRAGIELAAPLSFPRPEQKATGPIRRPEATTRKRPGIRTVVIDPGHGGIDPGAIGRSGAKEKDIVLAFAKELKEKIERNDGYEVVLTRSGDTFVSLKDRVRMARHANADLFIVVHADAVRDKGVRGATVYTLSETASDAEAEELAHNENKSDLIAGVDLAEESDEITGILIDLAQRETKNHASFFARSAVEQLKQITRFTGKPLRSAGFRVLRAPDVPSVLVELGYLSHAADESQLRSAAWRLKMAAQLAEAVASYFRTSVASGP
jgi:N-acetylmuramoyl-L-alanine amidase